MITKIKPFIELVEPVVFILRLLETLYSIHPTLIIETLVNFFRSVTYVDPFLLGLCLDKTLRLRSRVTTVSSGSSVSPTV